MAIILFGPTVIGARGKIAGTIFSANKGGPFARAWSRGSNPNSALQSAHRGRLGSLAAAWRDLTTPQRADWDDYADDPAQELTNSLGVNYFASGFNWYIRINLNLEAAGAARRVDAPTLVRPLAPIFQFTTLVITGGSPASLFLYTGASPNLGFFHTVFARLYNSHGRTTSSEKRTFILLAIPTPGRAILFQPEIETAFGTIALGQIAFYESRTQDPHGQRGPADTASAEAEV